MWGEEVWSGVQSLDPQLPLWEGRLWVVQSAVWDWRGGSALAVLAEDLHGSSKEPVNSSSVQGICSPRTPALTHK